MRVQVRVQVRVRVSSAAAYRCSSVSLGSARRPSRPGSSSASSSPPLSRQCSTNGLSTVVRKPRPVQTLSELPALWKQTMRNLGASTFFHFGNHRLSSASVTGGSIGPAAAVAGCVPTSGSWPPFSKYSRTVVSSHRLIFSKTISTSSARQSAWMSSSSSKVSGMETGDRLGTGGGQRVLISPACVVRARDDELGRDDATTVCRLVKKDPKRKCFMRCVLLQTSSVHACLLIARPVGCLFKITNPATGDGTLAVQYKQHLHIYTDI